MRACVRVRACVRACVRVCVVTLLLLLFWAVKIHLHIHKKLVRCQKEDGGNTRNVAFKETIQIVTKKIIISSSSSFPLPPPSPLPPPPSLLLLRFASC